MSENDHDVLFQQMGKLQGQVEGILAEQISIRKTTYRTAQEIQRECADTKKSVETRLMVLENHRDNDRLKIARLQWTLGPIGLLGTALGVIVAKYLKLG